jgi:hypothetical protein
MNLHEIFTSAIEPAFQLLPEPMASHQARVMLLAIGLQESRFEHRFQVVQGLPGAKGPARGFWQFEQGGGCAGVLRHAASRYWMHSVCKARGCEPTPKALWLAIENDDVLAAAAARLLLFTDPKRLPPIGDADGAWQLYTRVWRPGKPHPSTWPDLYARAVGAVQSTAAV